MTIQLQQGNEAIATISQRLSHAGCGVRVIPLKELARVTGFLFASIQDEIPEALRASHYKPSILTQSQTIELNEVSGVRLAPLFKAIAPLSTADTIRTMP